jgi:aspartate kinase
MSGIIVLKFGGTSLGSPARQRHAARRVRAHLRQGRRVVVVVSATGHTTDHILARINRLSSPSQNGSVAAPQPVPFDTRARRFRPVFSCGPDRELDRALATGEDLSAAQLTLALWQLGVPARSLRGGEAGIRATGEFGAGFIDRVRTGFINRLLLAGVVPVISGFQGERDDGETITLGRGGSDTSAVAIAAALRAVCHIVSDVPAVFDRDPNQDSSARPFARLSHAELVQLAESGARVMHACAARLAATARVPLRIYSFRAPLSGAGTSVSATNGAAATNGNHPAAPNAAPALPRAATTVHPSRTRRSS